MANTFRSAVGGYRREAFQNAMAGLSGGSAVGQAISRSSSGASEKHLDAINRASLYQSRAANMGAEFMNSSDDMNAQAMAHGMELASNKAQTDIQIKLDKQRQKAETGANTLGLIAKGVSTVAPFLLACERRLKDNIKPIDENQSWKAVRDIPIYSFVYKQCPTATCYGPMVDEVAPVDPSLVRPSLLGTDEEGLIHGFDVLRYQAMMAVALRQALCRIEALEASLGATAPARPWPVNVAVAAPVNTQPWPAEVADAP